MTGIIQEGGILLSNISDPIRTEETIFYQLRDKKMQIPYVAVPLAYRINTQGIQETQNLINRINDGYPGKKFFVCQHILVNQLEFGDNFVFTPHTTAQDNYHFIPHYNPAYETPPARIPLTERVNKFSFVGDYNTNPLREEIGRINSPYILSQPTGRWFFSHDESTQKTLKSKYKEILENTQFPLCPQGTGPSTLRFFESLSTGGIPVLFNDLKIPEGLEKLVVRSTIESLRSGDILSEIENLSLEEISKEIYDLYWSEYSNQNLGNSILEKIKKL